MSEENVDKLRRVYESLNRGDFDDAVSIAHPDIVFLPPGEEPPYRGIASVRKWMEPDAFEDHTIDPLEFIPCRNKVLVKAHEWVRGAGSGIEMEIRSWTVWTFDENGLVTQAESYLEHEEEKAREAAGLSE